MVNTLIMSKAGTALHKGYIEVGTEDNYVWYGDGKWYSNFHYEAITNGVYWPFSASYDQDTSMWFEVVFETPSNFTFELSGGSYIYSIFGLVNITDMINARLQNTFAYAPFNFSNPAANGKQLYLDPGAGATLAESIITPLLASTRYKIQAVWNTTTNAISGTLYDENDNIIETYSDTGAGTETFEFNAFGFYPYSDAVNTKLSEPYKLISFKVVAGLADVAQPLARDDPKAVIQVKPTGNNDYIDITTHLQSAKIVERMNESTTLDLELINVNDQIRLLFGPNADIKVRIGIGEYQTHAQFWGYIPARKDYVNKAHIQDKDETYSHDTAISLFGENSTVIPPASEDYPPNREDAVSSEQEDMYRAQKFVMKNSDPQTNFKGTERIIKIQALDYWSKATTSYVRFDKYTNYDNQKIQSGIEYLVRTIPGEPLEFVCGASEPRKILGDTETDWKKRSEVAKGWLSDLEDDTDFPNAPKEYMLNQFNYGTPTMVLKPIPSILSNPVVTHTISESDILMFKYDTQGGLVIRIKPLFILNLGDVVYIDTDDYGLRSYRVIKEKTTVLSTSKITVELVLSEKKLFG